MSDATTTLARAQGCMLGQLAGDSLGSLVEFRSVEEIRRAYPKGVRRLADGGAWDTIAGQPTDDSEMALVLARMLAVRGEYDPRKAFESYRFWFDSRPFDCGRTVHAGLMGRPNHDSQANGAMMRISPLGIFGAGHPYGVVAGWARQDAELTHPNPVCVEANALFAAAIAHAVRTGATPRALHGRIVEWAEEFSVPAELLELVRGAADAPPAVYDDQRKGWVMVAFGNALWQMLHAPDLETGVVDTVMRGGDTDTNAAIAGALLGAVHGVNAVPAQWTERVLTCRPEQGRPGVRKPRPECFWPVDALDLAGQVLLAGGCPLTEE